MAFGMSPFPLRFGSRGGGAVGASPLSATQLRSDLAAFGFAITRSGSKHSQTLDTGLSGVEGIGADTFTFERVTIGNRDHLGLLVMPSATPLVSNSNNLSGWSTTGSPSVVYTASGGLNNAGYTTITGTGGAWTVSNALTSTSGNRTSRVRCFAPGSNAGAITLSQDNGSTTATVTEDSQDTIDRGVALTAQTSTNPTLQVAGSGTDTVIIYDFQHGKPVSGVPAYKWHAPQAGSRAVVGADLINKTYGDDLTDIDISILFKAPPTTNLRYVLAFNNFSANADPMIGIRSISGNIGTYRGSGGVTTATIVSSFTPGQLYLLDMQANATHFRVRERGGSWQGLGAIPSGVRQFLVGQLGTTVTLDVPIAAMQDNNGNVFGSAGTWNAPALTDFEATL